MRYPKRPGSSIGDEMVENGTDARDAVYIYVYMCSKVQNGAV